jgi:hypothetical protein
MFNFDHREQSLTSSWAYTVVRILKPLPTEWTILDLEGALHLENENFQRGSMLLTRAHRAVTLLHVGQFALEHPRDGY